MHWTRSERETGIFELMEDARLGAPLARLGFISEDKAACEIGEQRIVFSYVSDPKSVHMIDKAADRVLGVIPLSWKDSGTLNLGGEKIEWQYAGIFSKARQWVRQGTMLVELGTIDGLKPVGVKVGAESQATLLLAALGWFLKLRCDATVPPEHVANGFAWARPAPKLVWTESEHPEAQFELRLGDGDPLAQLTIVNATTGAGAVKRFGGSTDEGKWILELAAATDGLRKLEVRNADTKVVVATMDAGADFAGELSFAGARYPWRCDDGAWSFTAEDGKPILGFGKMSVDAIDLELELHGEHPHASFLAFAGFFLIAMKYASDGATLLDVSFEEHESAPKSTSGSGLTAGDAIDVAGAIFDLLD